VTAKSPWLASESEKRQRKICDSLETAIRRSGLQNGMTISFTTRFAAVTKWSIWWWRSWRKWAFAI
jgi:citrate lyase alpha subunit